MEVAGGVRTVPERLTLDPATVAACDRADINLELFDDDDDNDGHDDDGDDFADDFAT